MDSSHKIYAPADLILALDHIDRPLVFTNGCFDLLHLGHITYLEEAKSLGKKLMVAVNSDLSVKRQNKGSDRPINPLHDRLRMLAALEAVDFVTWFDEDTPIHRILESRPDILVKGGDWPVDRIVGAAEVIGWGGKVVSIDFKYQRSTTALLSKIRASLT